MTNETLPLWEYLRKGEKTMIDDYKITERCELHYSWYCECGPTVRLDPEKIKFENCYYYLGQDNKISLYDPKNPDLRLQMDVEPMSSSLFTLKVTISGLQRRPLELT